MNLFNYKRRDSSEVIIGNTPMGAQYPIRIQSMANTSTLDTEASVNQAMSIIRKGADYVRFTAQGVREAENLRNIRERIFEHGYPTPMVADIHFNPKAADAAALQVEKVRINPGNYVDSIKTFSHFEYTDEEYGRELDKIRARFVPFLDICKANQTAIRIGVNHGSLSDRIMSRYGDTPEGMVESCMEFLRICVDEDFRNVVISIKASNTTVMVRTVRLLVSVMENENMAFPLHLGVTEAGDGEDGRIKSAVGIGALLADGIGDTIRVSLSEAPENEIPVARKLVNYISFRENHAEISGVEFPEFNYFNPQRRLSRAINSIGGGQLPVVLSMADHSVEPNADFYFSDNTIVDNQGTIYPIISMEEMIGSYQSQPVFLPVTYDELTEKFVKRIVLNPQVILLLLTNHLNGVGEQRAFFHFLQNNKIENPVIIARQYNTNDVEDLQLMASADLGPLLLDGFGDGVLIANGGNISHEIIHSLMFGILQATRLRTTKTEYISCPGCGRTLFDLQSTIARVKSVTSHLTGLKIGIMGCIVNGPGEMADADYGYVGAGRGRVSLYKNKTCIEKNIPEENAVDKLVELINQHGDWIEKSEK